VIALACGQCDEQFRVAAPIIGMDVVEKVLSQRIRNREAGDFLPSSVEKQPVPCDIGLKDDFLDVVHHLAILRLALAQLVLHLLAVGDVAGEADRAEQNAIVADDRRLVGLEPAMSASVGRQFFDHFLAPRRQDRPVVDPAIFR